jgi:exopolysaccharide biosynthesis polyprenyl glycosylphosphotransferase
MDRRNTLDVVTSCLAVAGDAVAIYAGIMTAVWIRFFSVWMPPVEALPPLDLYWQGAGIATLLFVFIFAALGLYARPQLGGFGDKLPRILRAVFWSIGLAMILAFVLRTEPPFSRLATGISMITVLAFVSVERYVLFKLELYWAKKQQRRNRITILGTGENAVRLKAALEDDPRLRSEVTAFLSIPGEAHHPQIDPALILGDLTDLQAHIDARKTDHVILSQMSIRHEEMVDIIVQCERSMLNFHLVPDLFRILTSKVDVHSVDGIPLLGMGKWPLDYAGNRMLKRLEDIIGSLIGLTISAPLIVVLALLIKRTSPGPVFFRQKRCGESGRNFTIYKLRTMAVDAESQSGPVWAVPDDPRRTPLGSFMRRYNLDEVPQFWNVLRGDMSLVGPRPERPHFVRQFKEDIGSYMWRHIYKPGMTGWAQVNGLRGNTSIEERIKYDLYYLENWSISFDFKILVKTFMARDNAY